MQPNGLTFSFEIFSGLSRSAKYVYLFISQPAVKFWTDESISAICELPLDETKMALSEIFRTIRGE